MVEALTMIEAEVLILYDKFPILSTYHLHILGLHDRVISRLPNQVLCKEFLHAGLHFPIHLFLVNIFDFYQVVLA